MVNPLLTKHIRSRRLDIGRVLFCVFTDFDLVSGLKKNFGLASILRYHMTGSASGYHETNTVFWSATCRASEMSLSCPLGVFRVGPARKIKRTWPISSLSRSCPHSWLITHTWWYRCNVLERSISGYVRLVKLPHELWRGELERGAKPLVTNVEAMVPIQIGKIRGWRAGCRNVSHCQQQSSHLADQILPTCCRFPCIRETPQMKSVIQ